MTTKRTPRGIIDLERALIDDDYYADVRKGLKGDARKAFERAVDDAWREKQPASTTNRSH